MNIQYDSITPSQALKLFERTIHYNSLVIFIKPRISIGGGHQVAIRLSIQYSPLSSPFADAIKALASS